MTIKFQSPIATVFATAVILTSQALSKDTAMKEKNTSKIMHRVIDAWIDIDAQPEEVWEVLVDFKSWESWNSFIPMVEGNLQVGERMRIKVVPPDIKPMIFEPEVYEVILYKKILWGGSFLKIIYRGDHAFLLEPGPDEKTRFRQIERFMGPMVLLMGGMIEKTEVGYHQMNRALKERVEKNKMKQQCF